MDDDRLSYIQKQMEECARRRVNREPGTHNCFEMIKSEILLLCSAYEERLSQQYRLLEITNAINSGFTLEQTLDLIFEKFDSLIPYDRIGFSLLEDEGRKLVVHWSRSRAEKV